MSQQNIIILLGVLASIVTIVGYFAGWMRSVSRYLKKHLARRKTIAPEHRALLAFKPLAEPYEQIWNSDASDADKIAKTKQIIPPDLHEFAVLDLGIDIQIEKNGNGLIKWQYELANISEQSITSDVLKVWFANPQSFRDCDFRARDLTRNKPCALRLVRDLPNFKHFLIEFPFPISPSTLLNYEVTYKAFGEFTDLSSYWWETEIVRITNRAHVSITMPPGTELQYLRSTEIGPHSEDIDKSSVLHSDILRSRKGKYITEQYQISWVRTYPHLGSIYKISWNLK